MIREDPESSSLPSLAIGGLLVLAGIKLLLHVVVNVITPYEFHRDEFLYFAMGEHLRLWRMDFPPMIAILANAVRGTLGDSLVAIRMVPALAGAAIVLLAGAIARELGGDRRPQLLAAFALLPNPLFLRSGNLFQPVVLDQLWWTLALFALARIARVRGVDRQAATRGWILLGVACGLGLLAKFSILVLGASLAVALLATPLRRDLLTPWPWIAVALALAIGSPSIVGQILLGFPLRDQMGALRDAQLARVGPAEFFGEQLLWGPGTVLAFAGIIVLLVADRLRPFRVVGWTTAIAMLAFLALHGKAYYAGPLHPTLIAATMVVLVPPERSRSRAAPRPGWRIALQSRWRIALVWTALAAIVAYGLVALPLGVPILRPVVMERYTTRLGLTAANETNRGEEGRLPQDYADMLGWEQQAQTVARVYADLPPEDRARVVIVGGNYGEAGALDFYGPRLGLPRAVFPAGSYWFFGPGDRPGEVAIVLVQDEDLHELSRYYASTKIAATLGHPYAVREESRVNVVVARDPRATLQEIWPTFAHRN